MDHMETEIFFIFFLLNKMFKLAEGLGAFELNLKAPKTTVE